MWKKLKRDHSLSRNMMVLERINALIISHERRRSCTVSFADEPQAEQRMIMTIFVSNKDMSNYYSAGHLYPARHIFQVKTYQYHFLHHYYNVNHTILTRNTVYFMAGMSCTCTSCCYSKTCSNNVYICIIAVGSTAITSALQDLVKRGVSNLIGRRGTCSNEIIKNWKWGLCMGIEA